jgi:hypothetical protein
MENENPNYYAVIPANVRYCKGLSSTAKLLYGEIAALANAEGYCWATNTYFAKLFDMSVSTIAHTIGTIEEAGFIKINNIYGDNGGIIQRRMYIIGGMQKTAYPMQKTAYPMQKTARGYAENCMGGMQKIAQIIKQDNNINNIYKGTDVPAVNKSCGKTVHNCQKPTVDEIKAYCEERKNGVNAEQFFDYYESKGWVVGKSKMKDWRASVRTWERNSFAKNGQQAMKQQQEEPRHWFELCPTCKEKKLEWNTQKQRYICACGASYTWEVINR